MPTVFNPALILLRERGRCDFQVTLCVRDRERVEAAAQPAVAEVADHAALDRVDEAVLDRAQRLHAVVQALVLVCELPDQVRVARAVEGVERVNALYQAIAVRSEVGEVLA